MASYRFLQDAYVAGQYFNAGDVATLPNSFAPPGAVDPLDSAGVTAFFNAGPQICGLIRARWSTQFVAPPYQWQLTGLGSGMIANGGPLSLP